VLAIVLWLRYSAHVQQQRLPRSFQGFIRFVLLPEDERAYNLIGITGAFEPMTFAAALVPESKIPEHWLPEARTEMEKEYT
jgi:hypothetical protein